MEEPETYDNFPIRIALLSNLIALAIYALGAYLISWLDLVSYSLYSTCFIVSGLNWAY